MAGRQGPKTIPPLPTLAASFAALALAGICGIAFAGDPADEFAHRFAQNVQPLLKSHCFDCHGDAKQEGKLKLSNFGTADAVAQSPRLWQLVRQRLEAGEMPPEDAEPGLSPDQRRELIAWIKESQEFEAERNAGDPGLVLARRLSNAEFDYTIRDLTGVDIRPTREFPVDPANEAGFDNSGESLAMSPALLQKYLAAARAVADHVVLKPQGFVFASHPAVTETDRDKYCVQRIIDFYRRHEVDYADYFLVAWQFRYRQLLGIAHKDLRGLAAASGLSPKYLETIWAVLNGPVSEAGPLGALRTLWRELPVPEDAAKDAVAASGPARTGCERMRDVVILMRNELAVEAGKLQVQGISDGSQPLVLWRNRQSATLHRRYAGDVATDAERLQKRIGETHTKLTLHFELDKADQQAVMQHQAAYERFCHEFPRAFAVSDRGPYFDPKQAGQGRLLTAGFHLMQGYFRDDQPLCELVLDEEQQRELAALWQELNFITLVPLRQYKDFIFFERAEPPRFMREADFDFARSEDKDATSAEKMKRLAELHVAKARRIGASAEAVQAIETYYANIGEEIRRVERERLAAEPTHVAELLSFAELAYRRPLSDAEGEGLAAFYRTLRDQDGLSHEEAIRDSIASVLLSPHFCYRFDLAATGVDPQPLSDYALASRLSYFLWSSMPDQELLSLAARGELHQIETLKEQVPRMLCDPKVSGLATEFGGNWLDFRRFKEHNGVDRERFPSFTPELRRAMFEEPTRFFVDAVQNNRSVLDFLNADDTFVNPTLARHYGIPIAEDTASDSWVRVEDAGQYGRGGLLPMAVFQTKNAPGLRTSPVKRGYWVVRRLLGEHIPPPPPTVPELPQDEANLGELTLPQLLAHHRNDKSCAGCHQRFDSIGLAFEGYGPVGERRNHDLGGRPIEDRAVFPDGREGEGLVGLRRYLREQRHADFLDHFCRQLGAYALGRGLLLSDEKLIHTMKARLAADEYAIQNAVEEVVLSRQFLYQRGRSDSHEAEGSE